MFRLDEQFLKDVGLALLPAAEKNKMLKDIYETLEMRVGSKLADQMSDNQLEEFEDHINRKDEAGALKWLETNFPDYKKTVADELEKLKSEITQAAPQILSELQTSQQLSSN
jgi:predicted RNA-binding Zn ribbon-like protein